MQLGVGCMNGEPCPALVSLRGDSESSARENSKPFCMEKSELVKMCTQSQEHGVFCINSSELCLVLTTFSRLRPARKLLTFH